MPAASPSARRTPASSNSSSLACRPDQLGRPFDQLGRPVDQIGSFGSAASPQPHPTASPHPTLTESLNPDPKHHPTNPTGENHQHGRQPHPTASPHPTAPDDENRIQTAHPPTTVLSSCLAWHSCQHASQNRGRVYPPCWGC